MSKPTFANLERFLLQLGFRKRSVPDSHLLFEHPRADTWIMLRPYREDETVDPAALAYVRRTLDEWDILASERFDEQLRQHSLAS